MAMVAVSWRGVALTAVVLTVMAAVTLVALPRSTPRSFFCPLRSTVATVQLPQVTFPNLSFVRKADSVLPATFGPLPPFFAGSAFAILSTTAERRYAFFSPLTALLWRVRVGLTPVVFLVSSADSWSHGPALVTRNFFFSLVSLGLAKVVEVPCKRHCAFVAQAVRLFFSCLSFFSPSSWAVISDADLWPINRDFFFLGRKEKKMVSHNALCCNHFFFQNFRFRELPIGSVSGTISNWREIFFLPRVDNASLLAPWIERRAEVFFGTFRRNWNDDQIMLSVFLQSAVNVSRLFFSRDTSVDRLDRSNWPRRSDFFSLSSCPESGGFGMRSGGFGFRSGGYLDAHLPKNGLAHWNSTLRVLFFSLLPPDKEREKIMQLADDYVAEFAEKESQMNA